MNDEEIDMLIANAEYEPQQLKDYITNLQHTKEYLGEVLYEKDKELEDYKSRVEKAVEYMIYFIFEPLSVQEDRKLIMFNENLRKFENILNGRSDE